MSSSLWRHHYSKQTEFMVENFPPRAWAVWMISARLPGAIADAIRGSTRLSSLALSWVTFNMNQNTPNVVCEANEKPERIHQPAFDANASRCLRGKLRASRRIIPHSRQPFNRSPAVSCLYHSRSKGISLISLSLSNRWLNRCSMFMKTKRKANSTFFSIA